MSDLSIEQCRNLASRGLPQELRAGDRYWGVSHRGEWYCSVYQWNQNCDKYYKIPDLQELMGFAVQVCRDVHEDLFDRLELVAYEDTYQVLVFTSSFHDDRARTYTDPHHADPKQAVYKLIEKVKDENDNR